MSRIDIRPRGRSEPLSKEFRRQIPLRTFLGSKEQLDGHKQGLFKIIYKTKINVNGSTHTYVKAKSQLGNIRAKYLMTTQKGQSCIKFS